MSTLMKCLCVCKLQYICEDRLQEVVACSRSELENGTRNQTQGRVLYSKSRVSSF